MARRSVTFPCFCQILNLIVLKIKSFLRHFHLFIMLFERMAVQTSKRVVFRPRIAVCTKNILVSFTHYLMNIKHNDKITHNRLDKRQA